MSVVARARRIVVKVGSSLVTNEGRGVDAEAIGNWSRQLAEGWVEAATSASPWSAAQFATVRRNPPSSLRT